jgi:protein-S-isoprenylcysteine O-methyltransferase Ste14
MFNSIFKIIYFLELLVVIAVRKNFERQYLKLEIAVDNKTRLDIFFLMLNGVGMIIPIIYVLTPWLDFANYVMPQWLNYAGAGLFAIAIYLIWQSHHDLGRNWTPVVALRNEAKLITGGIFTYIRHPMYAAHLLWAVAQVLLLPNWLAGYSFLIVQIPFCYFRIRDEEKMMLKQFDNDYRSYMARTKRLIPGIL